MLGEKKIMEKIKKENKKVQGFAIDKDNDDFIERKRWDLKTSRSHIVNEALKYFKENENQLDEIIQEDKKDVER